MTEPVDTSQISDGYHTFAELYRYRLLYNAAAFNAWAALGIHDVHKSWRHSDGEECFGGGWFIVMATLPTGQISNHYPEESWHLFRIPEREVAAEWDGHTADDAADRLEAAAVGDDGVCVCGTPIAKCVECGYDRCYSCDPDPSSSCDKPRQEASDD